MELEEFINNLISYTSNVNESHANIEKDVKWKSGLRDILAVGVDSDDKKEIVDRLKRAKNALEDNMKRCKNDQDVINEAMIKLFDIEDGADLRNSRGRKCTSDNDSGIGGSADSAILYKVLKSIDSSLNQLVDELVPDEEDDARSTMDDKLDYPTPETDNSDAVGNPLTREECNDPAESPPTNQEPASGCAAGGEVVQLGRRAADTGVNCIRKSDPREHEMQTILDDLIETIRSLTSQPRCSYTPKPRRNTERPKRDSDAFVSSIGPADQRLMAAQGINTRKVNPNRNILTPEPASSGATMSDHMPRTDESTEPSMTILALAPDALGATIPDRMPRTDESTEASVTILTIEPDALGATMPDRMPRTDESTEPSMTILTIEPDALCATMPDRMPRTDASTATSMNILAPEPASSVATMPDRMPRTDESTDANMNILTLDLGATIPDPGPGTDASTGGSLQKTHYETDV